MIGTLGWCFEVTYAPTAKWGIIQHRQNALNSAPPPSNPLCRKSDHRRNQERQDRNREGRDLCTPRQTPDNGRETASFKVEEYKGQK